MDLRGKWEKTLPGTGTATWRQSLDFSGLCLTFLGGELPFCLLRTSPECANLWILSETCARRDVLIAQCHLRLLYKAPVLGEDPVGGMSLE